MIAGISCNNNIQKADKKDKMLLTKNIQYDVFIESPFGCDDRWWKDNIERSKRFPFVKKIVKQVYAGDVKSYDLENNLLTVEQAKNMCSREDTFTFQRRYEPYDGYDTIIKKDLNPKQINKIRFEEEWYFDDKTLEIEKEVTGICPMYASYDNNTGEQRSESNPLFWIKFDNNKQAKTEKFLLTERIQYDVIIKEHKGGNKFLNTFNIEKLKFDVDTFINTIINTVFNDKVKAYEYDPYDFGNVILTGKEIKNSLTRIDSITLQKPYEPYDWYDTVIVNTFNYKEIAVIRFLEEWYFDEETLEIEKKVLGICPIIPAYDNATSEFKGYKPLFWIYFNDRYPPKE